MEPGKARPKRHQLSRSSASLTRLSLAEEAAAKCCSLQAKASEKAQHSLRNVLRATAACLSPVSWLEKPVYSESLFALSSTLGNHSIRWEI